VRSIKSECLSKLILFGEASLRRAITQFIDHYHLERPHQGKGNQLLFRSPVSPPSPNSARIQCHHHHIQIASNVTNASAACSTSISAPHEYFDPTGKRRYTAMRRVTAVILSFAAIGACWQAGAQTKTSGTDGFQFVDKARNIRKPTNVRDTYKDRETL
jgi:phage terminase large subunit GpA-like protein